VTDDLGLDANDGAATDEAAPAGATLVEVAVDAPAGPGPRTYTYAVPDALGVLQPGEVVLVPFGRGGRQALGVALGPGRAPADDRGLELRPVAARVRSDGAIVPALTLRLARLLADRYLAPVSTVLRAMLPPGMLERLELVAEVTPRGEAALGRSGGSADRGEPAIGGDAAPGGREGPTDGEPGALTGDRPPGPDPASGGEAGRLMGSPQLAPVDLDLLEELSDRPRSVRALSTPEGRAALLRRLRALEAAGHLELTWTLVTAATGPRYERLVWVTAAGRAMTDALSAGVRTPGRAVGPRQRDALTELVAASAFGPELALPSARLAERHGSSGLAGLVRRGILASVTRERPRRPLSARPAARRPARPVGSALTAGQAAALELVVAAVANRDETPILLDGVTGGGKTALYLEAIRASLDLGRPALMLVPEIALATPIVDRVRAGLGARIALLHSGLGDGERADEWRRIRAGDVDLVVGTRTALLAPLADVGLIVVDEEHDPAYKSDRTPRFQARDGAVALAGLAGAAVVLGSATPAVESVGLAAAGRYRRAALASRPAGHEPAVSLVDMRAELAAGNRSLLSGALTEALSSLDTTRAERAILVINRRGTASVVLCRDCGHVQACADCERPLVYHQAGGSLRCHHCGRAWPPATRCPACGSARIRYLGGGTERVEREVRERFPLLRVGRLDRDVVERRGAADRVLDAFTDGRLDVLVGTGLVTKGLDIPEVTLVGVVSADVALNLPDERAAERTYQLLAQAIGRAGRGSRPGRAIIQTYRPEHRAIRAVVEHTPSTFYAEELALRERFRSPPYGRLVKLTVAMADRSTAEREAAALAERLRVAARTSDRDIMVVGPAPAYIARRAERWRYHVVLRGDDPAALLDPPPGPPWSIDVDPESLL
jgi:primosomal protein N' (replication factor Y)